MLAGFIAVILKILPIVVIMVAIAVLGLIGIFAAAGMVGLLVFSKMAKEAFANLQEALPAVFDVLKVSEETMKKLSGGGEEQGVLGKIISKIPGAGGIADTIALVGKFRPLITILSTLGIVGMMAGPAARSIRMLKEAGSALNEGIPGILSGLKQMPAFAQELSNFDEKEFRKQLSGLQPILYALADIGKGLKKNSANIKAIKDTSNAFKISLEENILTPVKKLDPAIDKLGRLREAVSGLNEELKKLADDNQGVIEMLADIGNGGGSKGGGAMKVDSSQWPKGGQQLQQDKKKDPNTKFLDFIANDVHGIAQQVITKKVRSWADNAKPTM
jgi:hypothetical protein